MPREIAISQTFTVFGVRVVLQSEDCDALDAAQAVFDEWNNPDLFEGDAEIYVVLNAYDVNETTPADASHVEGTSLAITSHGVSAWADGMAGRGRCNYPHGAANDSTFSEMVNTVVLFLLAHTGRIPVHASAVMLGDIAVILAGKSGSGKSSLALAANRAGLPILSDDTVFVQTELGFRIWALTKAIHVFEKDAPADAAGGAMRFRSGRWKRALPIATPRHMAKRAVLCVLTRGDKVALDQMAEDEAVAALTETLESGYEFYGERSAAAIRALATGGCWRLTLSGDPAEAIEAVWRTFALGNASEQAVPFHRRYLALVDRIERNFPVAHWKSGDVDIWPLARMDLYLDMYWHNAGGSPPAVRAFPLRIVARAARPLLNFWKSRRDLAHWVARSKPAHAILLGDGVSLDRIDGAWQDRFGEPLISTMEKRGLDTFLMQSGDLSRLPWCRPTFAANVMEAWAWPTRFTATMPAELPYHEQVLQLLARNGVSAPSLTRSALARRASVVAATASAFERVLRVVKPTFAFVVTYYAGLGHAFVLACRRQGILSVDLQHCPQDGAHKAYSWSALPDKGYTTLPALFWNWTQKDAANIRSWADKLALPWHRSVYGGHTQIALFVDDANPQTKALNAKFDAISKGTFEREILVALQPIGGHRACWDALAAQIEAAPSGWRWWIRHHPSSRAYQDVEFGRLLSLRKPNVMIDHASALPLPVLLRHMSVVLSLASGASSEASAFGVPAFFLSGEARGPFEGLIERGCAAVIDVLDVNTEIARLQARTVRQTPVRPPDIDETLLHLEEIAREYAELCQKAEKS